jgi:hypothetical protein
MGPTKRKLRPSGRGKQQARLPGRNPAPIVNLTNSSERGAYQSLDPQFFVNQLNMSRSLRKHLETFSTIDDSLAKILYHFPMKTIEEILQEAEHLPLNQRLSLAHRLLVLSEPDASPDIDEAWDIAIRERIMRYDQGQTQSSPASEVFSELDNQLGR